MNPHSRRERFRRVLIVSAVLFFFLGLEFLNPDPGRAGEPAQPRFIFIFVADGAGTTHLEITRLYSRHAHREGLIISDRVLSEGFLGLMTTHSADSLITDSAAAATALAGGCKAKNGAVGICADGRAPKTVFEIAKERGRRLGLITNAEIYDATPAAFASHAKSRNLSTSIIDQYLKLEPNLLMGGGREYFLPESQPGSRRKDQKDMVSQFRKRGFAYAANREELMAARGPKLLGLFSLGPMSFETDRNPKIEPSLHDMTQTALRILQEDLASGFIILVENENIDSAGHGSNLAALVRDFKELDRAVGLAYEFYQQHPRETLILVTSDHETGGLTLAGKRRKLIPGFRRDALSELVGPEQARSIQISWSTRGHTAQPVFVGALGIGAERFRGYQDNTDFARHLFGLLGVEKRTAR